MRFNNELQTASFMANVSFGNRSGIKLYNEVTAICVCRHRAYLANRSGMDFN